MAAPQSLTPHEAVLPPLPAVRDNAAMQTGPPKAEPPKRKRRWFQFSLRSLQIAVALLAILSAWLGRKIDWKRKERDAAKANGTRFGFAIPANAA